MNDLETLWISETGTPPPAFGEDSPWDHLDELRRMSWADSFAWAERIKGSVLLPGQVRKLQKAHGFNSWGHAAKKTALSRRNGNGKNDPDGSAPPTQGSFASVNGWNPHNRKVAAEAKRLRVRVLAYCRTAYFRAQKSGATFAFAEVFRAACVRVFGRPEAYANRSRVKVFREWVEAKLDAKNVTHPPEAAPYNDARAMCYASPRLGEDNQDMTHRPEGTEAAGQDSEGSGEGDGIPDLGRAGAGGPLNPEGRCPSRLEPGPTPCSIRARRSRARLVGIARSALPTLEQMHADIGSRVSWFVPYGEADTQRDWALGWLHAWLRQGRSARRLTEIYAEGLRHFERRYAEAGYREHQCAPWALRGFLQRRAKDLPSYSLVHFEAHPARFAKTRLQAQEDELRESHRAWARLDKYAATIAPEETSPWEDEMADFNAEMAASAMDRRNARAARVSERDQWARDLGNA